MFSFLLMQAFSKWILPHYHIVIVMHCDIFKYPCPLFSLQTQPPLQNSIFTCPVFYLTFRHGQANVFLWTTKFQSGQVNLKSYLPSLATEVCASVCSTDNALSASCHFSYSSCSVITVQAYCILSFLPLLI